MSGEPSTAAGWRELHGRRLLRIEHVLGDLAGATLAVKLAAKGLQSFVAGGEEPNEAHYDALVAVAGWAASLAEGAIAMAHGVEPRWRVQGNIGIALAEGDPAQVTP